MIVFLQTGSDRTTKTGETTPEPNETFYVNLSNAINAWLAGNQGIGTIIS